MSTTKQAPRVPGASPTTAEPTAEQNPLELTDIDDKDAEIARLRAQLAVAQANPANPNDGAPDPLSETALSEKDEQIKALRTELAATRAQLPQHRNANDANLPAQSEHLSKERKRAVLTRDGWLAPNVTQKPAGQ